MFIILIFGENRGIRLEFYKYFSELLFCLDVGVRERGFGDGWCSFNFVWDIDKLFGS